MHEGRQKCLPRDTFPILAELPLSLLPAESIYPRHVDTTGGALSRPIRSRMTAKSCRDTATSASWKVT